VGIPLNGRIFEEMLNLEHEQQAATPHLLGELGISPIRFIGKA
jgi:hypothetical protein